MEDFWGILFGIIITIPILIGVIVFTLSIIVIVAVSAHRMFLNHKRFLEERK